MTGAPVIDLSGRHVLVVGGSRGIGAEAAEQAAAAGASVTITSVTGGPAAEAVAARTGGLAVQADASSPDDTRRAVAAAVGRFGPVSGLVVSAGLFEPARIEDMDPVHFDRVMAVNVRGTFLALQAVIPCMRGAGGGSVVIYTSTAGQRGSAGYSAYATSKGAQILLMRSAAMELAPDRIRVNCVAPAWTDSDMSRGPIDELGRDQVVAAMPLGRIGTPADVAAATCFLLSDLASYVTGSTWTVDGGQDFRG